MPKLLEVNDVIRAGRDEMIIVDVKPNRHANPYVAILMNGKGAPYKVGHKHNPQFVRKATGNEPALRAYQQREAKQNGPNVSEDYKRLVGELCNLVDQIGGSADAAEIHDVRSYADDAKALARAIRLLG
jgi:hypothetical protein